MSYVKHNFQTGDILYASELNEIDDQIVLNEQNIDNIKSQIKLFEDAVNFETNVYPLSGCYWGTIGSGDVLQVRTSTASYNGIIVPIPRGIQSIDFNDMTPYSIVVFTHYPHIGDLDGTGKTAVNKVLSFDLQNTYTWLLVTLRLSDSGNDKQNYTIKMHKAVNERLLNQEQSVYNLVNGCNVPIVCFIYDDNSANDDTLHEMLNERGLKGTFSTIGNTDPSNSSWKETATKLQNWCREGHGVLGHGLTQGVNVTILNSDTYPGISNISDADARKAITANNTALDYFNLPHNGIAYWNVWNDTPHSRNIVEKYYKYGFTFGGVGAGINTLATDKFKLTRYTTDEADHIDPAIDMLRDAVGQKCVICFGGHMSRTGTGTGTYSTMAQFRALLNAVRDYVNLGLMVSLNTDDAIKLFYGDGNGVKADYPYLPSLGELVYDSGLKVCTDTGAALIYRLTLTGTPADGHLTIPALDIDVDTYSTDTISDIINRIVSGSLHTDCTMERTSSTQCYVYANIAENRGTVQETVNTSGLTCAFAMRRDGVDPTWTSV